MIETKIVTFIQNHAVVAIQFLILFCKMLVRWVSRESPKDVFKSLLTLPLDFIYIGLGLVFAGLARKLPSLAARYGSDTQADFNLAVIALLLLAGAVAVTAMDRYVRVLWQKFYSAISLLRDPENGQIPLALKANDNGNEIDAGDWRKFRIFTWLLLYWAALVPLFFMELVVGAYSLGAILRRI